MDYLKAFNQIVNALETHQNDLKDLVEIKSNYQNLLNQLSKGEDTPANQEQIRRISKDLQYANKLIAKCQTAIQIFSQALSSPNPN